MPRIAGEIVQKTKKAEGRRAMSVQLLDKTRKINKLLHNNNSSKVVFNDICEVLSEILESNVLVISKKGKVLGISITPNVEEIKELIDDEVGGHIDELLNERFLGVLSTKENVNLETLGFESGDVKPLTVAVAAEVHDFFMMLLGKLVEDVLLHLHAHLLFHLLQFILFVGLSPYNIELATAALSFRVYLVAKTGCTQGTTLVEKLWINELGRDGIVRTTCAQHLAFRSAFAVRVAALNHKILDDTMEESAIEISLLCQLQEVVTMLGCLVVEAHLDVAL